MNEATESVSRAHKEIKLSAKDIERFWSKVDKDGPTQPHMTTPCWVWTAGKTDGYGCFRVGGNACKTHRVAWVMHHDQVPHDGSAHGICVCHQCDVRNCVNPSHLFLGTNTDNMRDKEIKGRGNHAKGDRHSSRTHPERLLRGDKHYTRLHPEWVPRGEANGLSKLTADKVIKIRSTYGGGLVSCHQLGMQFGVTKSVISKVIRYKLWKHI